MTTIHEIASELERLATEIGAINLRPFGERIDLQHDNVGATGEDADEGQRSVARLDS